MSAGRPLVIEVGGRPAPEGSHGPHGRHDSRHLGPWRAVVARAAALAARTMGWQRVPAHVGVEVHIEIRHRRPRAHYRAGRHASELREDAPALPIGSSAACDVDKAARAVLDALGPQIVRATRDGIRLGGVYVDDDQVVDLRATKRWAGVLPEGATITVRPWQDALRD